MYLEHFGLSRAPFTITPNTESFFEEGQRGEILSGLQYAVMESEGITKVVGEVGAGKTMLCRMLPTTLTKEPIDWVYLAHPSMTPINMLTMIARELGMDEDLIDDKPCLMHEIHACLLERYAQGRRVVVLVEEAQSISLESLEEIRYLSNLESEEHKLIHIVLFGQPELDRNLSKQEIRQLNDRIVHQFYLDAFTPELVYRYLNFRLRCCDYKGPDLFSKKVAKRICTYANGLIRRTNIIAEKCLLAAFSQGRHEITEKDAKYAAQDCQLRSPRFGGLLSKLKLSHAPTRYH